MSNDKIRYAPLFRIFSVFAILTFFGIAFIGWMAYRVEGELAGLWFSIPLVGVGVYWLYALAASPHTVTFSEDQLTIHRWIGMEMLPYEEVISITQSYRFINLTTRSKVVKLHKLYANDDAMLMNALETRVPALKAEREKRLNLGFPIIIKGSLTEPIMTFVIGSILAVFGIGTIGFALLNPADAETVSPVVMVVIGLMSIGFGLIFVYLVLWTFPRRTTFTMDEMIQQFVLQTKTQSMTGIVDIRQGHEIHTVRGVERKVYFITFVYNNDETFKWIPNEFKFPLNYIDAAESGFVEELVVQLRQTYLQT